MASVIKIYQGSGISIVASHKEPGIVNAVEIEVLIDCVPQIRKKLSAGEIINVSATSFTVLVEDSDVHNKKSGEYSIEARYTPVSGPKVHGRFNPSQVKIIDSAFDPVC